MRTSTSPSRRTLGFGSLSGPGTASGYDPAEMAELAARRGGDPDRPGKKDPLDALVWLAERPGEPAWDSRFGPGRPGWHVECAAIATEYLGTTFDVQAGGSDLVFPHHEMSASHARVALAPDAFARVYVHAGMVSLPRREDVQVAGQPGLREPPGRGRRRPYGYPDGPARAPLPIRLGVDRRRAGRCPSPPGPLACRPGPRRSRRPRARPPARRPGPGRLPAVPEPGALAAPASAADMVLVGVRTRLRDDLDAPGALAVVDRWADALLAEPPTRITPHDLAGARLVQATLDALLGISL